MLLLLSLVTIYMFTGYDATCFRLRYQLTEYETTAYKLRSICRYRVRYISIGVRYNCTILVTMWGYRVRHNSVPVTIQHHRVRHNGIPGTLRQYTGKFDTILWYDPITILSSIPLHTQQTSNLREQIKYFTEYIKFKKAYSLSQRPQVCWFIKREVNGYPTSIFGKYLFGRRFEI